MTAEDREHHRPKAGEPDAGQGEGQHPDSESGRPATAAEAPTAQIPVTSVPLRRCRRCSTESRTVEEFCPNCGARFDGGERTRAARLARVIALALVGLTLAAGAVAAFRTIRHANQRAAAERHRSQVRAKRQAAARG
jgi:hypothetical protein